MSYMFQYAGQCLGDLVESGAILSADTTAAIRPLDVVSVILKQALNGPFSDLVNSLGMGGHAGVVKVLLDAREMEGEMVYIVGQLNPPCLSPIPAGAIEAMHKVDGASLAGGPLGAHDQAAMKLLLPFAGKSKAVAPINPDYVSSWPATAFQELSP
ncbi:hypothetical protein GHK78_11805 [Sinorhizobium meliloti]|nr:hypothetical protein [Sinorhizobium meliloti]MQX63716.1 hypothetical protein [Sinorhizobium meliloti]